MDIWRRTYRTDDLDLATVDVDEDGEIHFQVADLHSYPVEWVRFSPHDARRVGALLIAAANLALHRARAAGASADPLGHDAS